MTLEQTAAQLRARLSAEEAKQAAGIKKGAEEEQLRQQLAALQSEVHELRGIQAGQETLEQTVQQLQARLTVEEAQKANLAGGPCPFCRCNTDHVAFCMRGAPTSGTDSSSLLFPGNSDQRCMPLPCLALVVGLHQLGDCLAPPQSASCAAMVPVLPYVKQLPCVAMGIPNAPTGPAVTCSALC